MNKWIFISLIILFTFLGSLLIINKKTLTAINYFPIDEEVIFENTKTSLSTSSKEKNNLYTMDWSSSSKSSEAIYLRQDISLLYVNGRFKGVQIKWIQNTETIQLDKSFTMESNAYIQAITYHHGEVHYPNNQIKSIQQMSHDDIYVTDVSKTLKEDIDQQLAHHWNQIIRHFNIDTDSYEAVPLTDLYTYNHANLPTFTKGETNQIIGQLWEGLYKNYVIYTSNPKGNKTAHYIPLILFDRQNTHLIVLFELNGKKEKLIQQYPAF